MTIKVAGQSFEMPRHAIINSGDAAQKRRL